MPRAATHTDLTGSYESISTAREGSDAAAPSGSARSSRSSHGFHKLDHLQVVSALARVGKADVVPVVAVESDDARRVLDLHGQCGCICLRQRRKSLYPATRAFSRSGTRTHPPLPVRPPPSRDRGGGRQARPFPSPVRTAPHRHARSCCRRRGRRARSSEDARCCFGGTNPVQASGKPGRESRSANCGMTARCSFESRRVPTGRSSSPADSGDRACSWARMRPASGSKRQRKRLPYRPPGSILEDHRADRRSWVISDPSRAGTTSVVGTPSG